MTAVEQKVKNLLRGTCTEELLETWEATTIDNDENIPTVRGWIMEELEKRYPAEFGAWLDSDEARDEDLRKYIRA